jgi:hypothetical protein
MTDPTIVEALEKALALHSKGHALDHFDWGKSFLSAEDIQELNELPFILAAALKLARKAV